MKSLFVTFCLFFILTSLNAQTYPDPILIGESKMVKADTVPLWILTNKQYKVAISTGKDLELANKEIAVLKSGLDTLKNRGGNSDSLINILKTDRDYYQKNWKTGEEDIIILGNKLKRQKLFTKISLICIPIAFLIGFFG